MLRRTEANKIVDEGTAEDLNQTEKSPPQYKYNYEKLTQKYRVVE